ncbi:DUF7551 domain-containing protein [Natrarchaeobaculum aegyptiacum]|uniref:Uncharacterized protein n=1 Tax=Natrarchaeobaculum aegyptiacum TaxID=745377 RepID=A0A2Z2HV54_9EURY|nr:hypothetical protein [Natrarchaeobaculum aegyptiacum]ARS89407.1 hypothetical protein B1756_06355 [Natrarchaeobaculum aegyptiacum]
MVGATLDDIRRYVESLASDSGEYGLICGRTGERPVPAAGLTFETRATARAAARATEQYRAALRRYDPQLPYYDVIACQRPYDGVGADGFVSPETGRSIESDTCTEPSTIDFCHAVAGAVFEAVAASSHADVERAIMDTYFDVAESTSHPDELCLTLVESMATELETALEPAAQLELLQSAATRLPSSQPTGPPLEATLSRLQAVAAVTGYSLEPTPATGSRRGSWSVTLEQYAFGRSADRLVTLPLGLELLRRQPGDGLAISSVERVADRSASWRLVVSSTAPSAANGIVRATPGCEP